VYEAKRFVDLDVRTRDDQPYIRRRVLEPFNRASVFRHFVPARFHAYQRPSWAFDLKEKFEYRRGYKFSTYASRWIREGEQGFAHHQGTCVPRNFSHAACDLDGLIKTDEHALGLFWDGPMINCLTQGLPAGPRSISTPFVIHDLRRSVASGMARLGINLPVIERVLNHVSGSFAGIVGVYQRHDFADEKREIVAVPAGPPAKHTPDGGLAPAAAVA
jgi:hypothetical protein